MNNFAKINIPKMTFIVSFFLLHWFMSLFFHTFFLHRFASHKMYETSKNWERIFYISTWFFQGSSYLVPRAYGVMHRMHHAFADTEKDPHSPKYDPNPLAMMWRTKNVYQQINKQKTALNETFSPLKKLIITMLNN